MTGATLRPARPADVDAVQRVEARAAELLRGHPAHAVFAASPTPARLFEDCVRAGRLLVAEVGGAVVGHAAWGELDGEAHLLQMDVDPASGRRGIGRALLRRVCDEATRAGYASMVLTTLSDVPWNAPFYAGAGFVPVSPEDWTPALRALMDEEAAAGFPMALRMAMRRRLR